MAPGRSPAEPADVSGVRRLGEFLAKLRMQRALTFVPHPKQALFLELGATVRKRAIFAANQSGKSTVAGFEIRCHLTGLYPDWWRGRRFGGPVRCWVGGPDATHVRDNMQRILFGPSLDEDSGFGTGMIERHLIEKVQRQSGGVQNAIDYAHVKHRTGGLSYVKTKSYDQVLDKWSGDTLHFVDFDEEPPEGHFQEGLTRTNYGDSGRPGMVMVNMTPLLGMSSVARRFYPHPKEEDAALVLMGLKDALHYRPEDIPKIAASYPEHERRARVEGKPQLGEGAVFAIDFDGVMIDPPERQRWWTYLGGLDFGGAGDGSHPSAAVEVAWDREGDKLYVLREHRVKGGTLSAFCAPLRRWSMGPDQSLPFAWPHDGRQVDRISGAYMRDLYENEGLLLLDDMARGSERHRHRGSLEESVAEIADRLATGHLKISRACPMLREEMEGYRREKGRIVPEYDDLISALRYAVMCKEFGLSAMRTGRDRIRVIGLNADPLEFDRE